MFNYDVKCVYSISLHNHSMFFRQCLVFPVSCFSGKATTSVNLKLTAQIFFIVANFKVPMLTTKEGMGAKSSTSN